MGGGVSNAFNNIAGGVFYAGTTVNLSGGTLTNAGTLALGTPSSIQTTALLGNYVQTTSGNLALALNAGTVQSSQLVVHGNVTLAGTIFVTQTGLPAAGTSEDFNILSANGNISIASNIVLPANSSGLSWSLFLDTRTNDVVLQETVAGAPRVTSASLAGVPEIGANGSLAALIAVFALGALVFERGRSA